MVQKAAASGGVIVLEPLPHFRQLKDLVVDLDPFFESLKAFVPWILELHCYDGRITPEIARKLEQPAMCILCGVCRAALDKSDRIEPAGLVKAMRFAMDPRDAMGIHRFRLMQVPLEVLKLFIKQLPEKCPKGIRISGDILDAFLRLPQ
jgi:succinate dehydrogenase / fumarate reductase iron-sulfur subunit